VLHTHGRHGPYHPHLHLLATSGGYEAQGARWEPRQSLPYDLRRRQWQWHLRTMRRQTRKTDAVQRWGDAWVRQYPDGRVTNGPKGPVPSQSQSLARYVATDVGSPPMAVRRIDRYDGQRVPYHARSHRPDRREPETVEVATFMGRLVPHTGAKGCKRLRYDGVQATKTCAQGKVVLQAALAKGAGVVKGAGPSIARLTSRQRYAQRTGRAPLLCPPCRSAMGGGASGPRPMG
jgi:Putative transposase